MKLQSHNLTLQFRNPTANITLGPTTPQHPAINIWPDNSPSSDQKLSNNCNFFLDEKKKQFDISICLFFIISHLVSTICRQPSINLENSFPLPPILLYPLSLSLSQLKKSWRKHKKMCGGSIISDEPIIKKKGKLTSQELWAQLDTISEFWGFNSSNQTNSSSINKGYNSFFSPYFFFPFNIYIYIYINILVSLHRIYGYRIIKLHH